MKTVTKTKKNNRDKCQDDNVAELAKKYKKTFEEGRFCRQSYINQIQSLENQLKASIRVAHDAADESFQTVSDCLVIFEKNLTNAKRKTEKHRRKLASHQKSIAKFNDKLDKYSGQVNTQLIEINSVLNELKEGFN